MKEFLMLSIKIISYFVTSSLLTILPQYCFANCNSLTLHADQIRCHNLASQYGIEDIELWQVSRDAIFVTELMFETPKLVVVEREESGDSLKISQFTDIPAGKLFLQEVEKESKAPDLEEGTLLRLKRQSDKSHTLMLILSPRSESDEFSGSGTSTGMNTEEDNSDAPSINPISIVVPGFFVVSVQFVGWFWTFTNMWDVYYYDRVNNGADAKRLSITVVFATALCTFGLNLIPNLIFYKIKSRNATANPV